MPYCDWRSCCWKWQPPITRFYNPWCAVRASSAFM